MVGHSRGVGAPGGDVAEDREELLAGLDAVVGGPATVRNVVRGVAGRERLVWCLCFRVRVRQWVGMAVGLWWCRPVFAEWWVEWRGVGGVW